MGLYILKLRISVKESSYILTNASDTDDPVVSAFALALACLTQRPVAQQYLGFD